MPQMSKGGKYIFGWSVIHENGEMTFPTSAFCGLFTVARCV